MIYLATLSCLTLRPDGRGTTLCRTQILTNQSDVQQHLTQAEWIQPAQIRG